MPLKKIVDEIYTELPNRRLYHYTSLGGALKIVAGKSLWATDIQYMSDASELAIAPPFLRGTSETMAYDGNRDSEVLRQFSNWVGDQFNQGHSQFVTCFSEQGNLLSQWRGYCPPGKGISLGFDPQQLSEAAVSQDFSLVKCIYDRQRQARLLTETVSAVEKYAKSKGKVDSSDANAANSYYPAFEDIKIDLLRIAVSMKSEEFSEEQEWRIVSTRISGADGSGIQYREGQSMLIPFIDFMLPMDPSGKLLLPEAFVGPTPHQNAAMNSVFNFLGAHVKQPSAVGFSGIPYRTW